MRTYISLRLFCLFFPVLVLAQSPAQVEVGYRKLSFLPVQTYEWGEFHLRPPSHFRAGAGQSWQRLGFTGNRLEKQVAANPLAAAHMQRYRSAAWAVLGCSIGGSGAGVLAVFHTIPYLGGVFGVYTEPSSTITRQAAFWWAAAGVFTAGGIVARRQATKHLRRAVSAYNEGLTAAPSRPSQPPVTLTLRPVAGETGSIGLGLQIRF